VSSAVKHFCSAGDHPPQEVSSDAQPFPPRTSALDRRHFLSQATGALGSVALASLLADDRWCRADESGGPIRPTILPQAPLRARAPHFAPKAKRVLMIFCSGALSHVDTWDYKPN